MYPKFDYIHIYIYIKTTFKNQLYKTQMKNTPTNKTLLLYTIKYHIIIIFILLGLAIAKNNRNNLQPI